MNEDYLIYSEMLKKQIDLNWFVNNPTLQNLTEPVMLVFGYINKKNKGLYQSGNFKAVEQYKNNNHKKVARALRKAGYRAVVYSKKEASRLNYIVVTKTGIITPFYQPDKAPEVARDILETLVSANVALPLSYVWGTTFNQLTYPAPRAPENFRSFLGGNLPHPDPQLFDKIKNNHEENFYKNMLNKARENKEKLSVLCSKHKFGMTYHGGITSQPDVIFAKHNLEARNIVYGTLEFKQAYKYALIKDKSRGKNYQYGFDFGFLHVYKPIGTIFPQPGGSEETGGINKTVNDAESKTRRFVETEFPLCKSNVEYQETLICFKDGAFLIPKDDDNWKDFKKLSEVSYYDEREQLLYRREKLMARQKARDGHVTTYTPKTNGKGMEHGLNVKLRYIRIKNALKRKEQLLHKDEKNNNPPSQGKIKQKFDKISQIVQHKFFDEKNTK